MIFLIKKYTTVKIAISAIIATLIIVYCSLYKGAKTDFLGAVTITLQ